MPTQEMRLNSIINTYDLSDDQRREVYDHVTCNFNIDEEVRLNDLVVGAILELY